MNKGAGRWGERHWDPLEWKRSHQTALLDTNATCSLLAAKLESASAWQKHRNTTMQGRWDTCLLPTCVTDV